MDGRFDWEDGANESDAVYLCNKVSWWMGRGEDWFPWFMGSGFQECSKPQQTSNIKQQRFSKSASSLFFSGSLNADESLIGVKKLVIGYKSIDYNVLNGKIPNFKFYPEYIFNVSFSLTGVCDRIGTFYEGKSRMFGPNKYYKKRKNNIYN